MEECGSKEQQSDLRQALRKKEFFNIINVSDEPIWWQFLDRRSHGLSNFIIHLSSLILHRKVQYLFLCWSAVIWPKYCRYGVKPHIINQSYYVGFGPQFKHHSRHTISPITSSRKLNQTKNRFYHEAQYSEDSQNPFHDERNPYLCPRRCAQ